MKKPKPERNPREIGTRNALIYGPRARDVSKDGPRYGKDGVGVATVAVEGRGTRFATIKVHEATPTGEILWASPVRCIREADAETLFADSLQQAIEKAKEWE